MKSTVVQYNSWHKGRALRKRATRVTDEEAAAAGDGRAEGSPAAARREAAISLMPDTDGTGSGSLMFSVLSTLLKLQSSDV